MSTMKNCLIRFLGWLLVIAFAQALLSGCLASKDYVDTRVEDVKSYADARDTEVAAKSKDAVLDIVSFAEPVFPGVTRAAEDVYAGHRVSAPQDLPKREDPFPWETLILALGSALGVGAPVSVAATNMIRNKQRKARGEAITPAEAYQKGYFHDSLPTEEEEEVPEREAAVGFTVPLEEEEYEDETQTRSRPA